MPEFWGTHDGSAKHVADGLVTQTYPKYRDAWRRCTNHLAGDASVLWAPGAWRNHDCSTLQRHHFINGHVIIANDDWFTLKLTEILHEVVDKAVVVVNHQNSLPNHGFSLPKLLRRYSPNCALH